MSNERKEIANTRITAVVIAMVVMPLAPRAFAQTPAATEPATGAALAPINVDPDQTARDLGNTLVDGSLPQSARDEAARRLLNLNLPSADAILKAALVDPNPASQTAVARALADDPQPDGSFVNPLFAAIGSNRALTEAACAALANFNNNSEVLTRLIDLASNKQRTSDFARAAAIRAIGSFSEKSAAQALLSILHTPTESAATKRDAADALGELSGITSNSVDARRWDEWWASNSQKPEAQFREDLLTRRSAELDRNDAHARRLSAAMENELRQEYQLTPQSQREALLTRWMKSPEPEIRARAADQIREDFTEARTFSDALIDQLRTMIGDSSALVRQRVTLAFYNRNDPQALAPLLQQLAHEDDSIVRMQIANALQNIGDVRAAPQLLKLLGDPSPDVQRAAASAFRKIAEQLQKQDPALAAKAGNALQAIIERTAGTPDQIELRAAAVEALAPLRQGDLFRLFLGLLNPRQESNRVRIAALSALGVIGNHNASDAIVDAINDPDDGVALAAVNALGNVAPSANQLEPLRPFLEGDNKRDRTITQAAWLVLQSSLPTLTKEQLKHWDDAVRADPNRQRIIRMQLLEVQTAAKELDEAATTQGQIAQNYMDLKQPDAAVPFYRAALEQRINSGRRGPVLDALITDFMNALLQSDKYDEAVAFAVSTLTKDSGQRSALGPLICARAEELSQSQQPEQLRKAKTLIDLTNGMSVSLGAQYIDRLNAAARVVDKRLADLTSQPGGPRSGNTPESGTKPPSVAGSHD